MNKRIIWIAVLVIFIVGITYLINEQKYTTFDELYSDQLNEDSIVRSVTIRIGGITENYAHTTIEDEEVIDQIVESLRGLELKENRNAPFMEEDYTVRITTTNEIEEGLLRTESFDLRLDGDYLNQYQVVGETDHLSIIERLVESEEVEWERE
ncbi:hypothetical protein [Lentibacillus sediminis]|uniref:hypothetical protein n=1 Tax=Lentibacillus sediminis TaxID=1940529 RepID=UPI000C1BE11D|nr:hypothetical protein [Lentibacillus sediminis]